MSTLYLDRKELEIRAERQHLILNENGERRSTIPAASGRARGAGQRATGWKANLTADASGRSVVFLPREPLSDFRRTAAYS